MATVMDRASFASDLVAGELEYAVLRPEEAAADVPLVYLLHGGGGDREHLAQMRPLVERCWESGSLPDAVVVTPSVQRSFYMNYRDGSRRYEDLLTGALLDHVRATYGAASGRASTAIIGISMGGMGGLRMAFKRPDLFAGVAALEPGIEPVLAFDDIDVEDRFWRDDALFERIYGAPVDREYWADNNPATIAKRDPARLSELSIFIECGDEDSFGLHRGTEFLHRVLWDAGVRHEYRSIRGADHLGRTIGPRYEAALQFVGRVLRPAPPDESLTQFHDRIAAMRRRAGLT